MWTAGEPDGCATPNTGPYLTVTQTTTVHSGAYAVRGQVIQIAPGYNLQPLLQSGPGGTGFPISQRYAQTHCFYRLSPVGGDRFGLNVVFYKNSVAIAVGAMLDSTTVSTYTEFVVNMGYSSSQVPDTAIIQISIVGPVTGSDFHVGSVMYVDDVSFSGVVAVKDDHAEKPKSYALFQNYPNPFNPNTVITYALPGESRVRVTILNLLGEEIATLVNAEEQSGVYTVQWNGTNGTGIPLASGMYFYHLQAEDLQSRSIFDETKKLMLLK